MPRTVPTEALGLPSPTDPKARRFHAVADAVVRQLLVRGPDDLRYSDLARSACVSRAWIYKYFGTDKDALLDYVVQLFGAAFGGLETVADASSIEAWRAHLADGVRQGLRDVEAAPWLMRIHGRYRLAPGRLGEGFRTLEARMIDKGVAEMPPRLARSRRHARHFVHSFTAARLGLYVLQADAVSREMLDEDLAVEDLMGLVDGFVARMG